MIAPSAVETLSRIEFVGELASLPPWSEALRPIVIHDVTTGEWIVVIYQFLQTVASGKPETAPIGKYRLQEGHWNHVPLSRRHRSDVRRTSHKLTVQPPWVAHTGAASRGAHRAAVPNVSPVNADPNQDGGEGYSSKP